MTDSTLHTFCLALVTLACTLGACDDATQPADGACSPDWQRPFAVNEEDYPFTSRCAELEHGVVHYIDEAPDPMAGPANGAELRGTVLAIHGNPTWSFLYRKLATQLLDDGFRVIAPDLYGFGMSDKPDVLDFDYRASSHAEVLSEFVRAMELTDVILVVQDWGGPMGLSMAAEMPERIAGIVIINTWSWEVARIPSGRTSFMHNIHDWGLENIINESYYEASLQTARRGGLGLGRRNGEPGSEVFTRIRDAFWGPFFALNEPHEPLAAGVVTPVNRLAQALLTDWQFLADLDRRMVSLHDKPVYFMYGDDTAFGPLKCDTGPSHSYDFEDPRQAWSDERTLCPDSLQCADAEPTPLRSNCVDAQGELYWGIVERYLDVWNPSAVVGVWQNPEAGHWTQETHPDQVADAVSMLRQATQD